MFRSRFRFLPALIAIAAPFSVARAQSQPNRVWIAGRYDGSRVIVYFNAAKFGDEAPKQLREITPPVAHGFFAPVELPAAFVARLQQDAKLEQFHLGDVYDLQLSGSQTVAVKLTSLIGFVGDEETGNSSYIGALATLNTAGVNGPFLADDYYILRPHPAASKSAAGQPQKPATLVVAHMENEPPPFEVQSRTAALLVSYRRAHPDKLAPHACDNSGNLSLSFTTQSVRLATGDLRYYVRAGWKTPQGSYGECLTGDLKRGTPNYVRGFWLAPAPALHIVSVEERTSPFDPLEDVLPDLLKAVGLGAGKTGLIVHFSGEDSTALDLLEYREGARLGSMPVLQSIAAGE